MGALRAGSPGQMSETLSIREGQANIFSKGLAGKYLQLQATRLWSQPLNSAIVAQNQS